jgi:outer membrane protein assembly factor BamB
MVPVLLLLSQVASGSWSEWRGSPDNAAVEVGNGPSEGVLRWRFETGNQVLSSPSYYEGGMLIGSDDGSLYCLDPLTGDLNWKFRTKGEVQATALIDDGRAYFGSFDRNFYCVDLPEGSAQPRRAWSFQCEGQIISSAHSIGGDLVFGCLNGTIYRIDRNGSLEWRAHIGNEIWASPLVDEASDRIFIGDIAGRFVCLDGSTGSILRATELGEFGESYSSPVLHDGVVFVTTGVENSLLGLDESTLEVVYRFDCGYATYSTPVVSGGRIYFGSFEYAWCVPRDDDDGNITPDEVIWSFLTDDFQGGSSPLVMDDSVFIGSDNYRVYCISREDGRERYNYSAGGYVYSSPAYHDGSVFFGSCDRSIYSVGDPGSGLLTVGVVVDPAETTADSSVKVTVDVRDQEGAPVAGAQISIKASAGEVLFSDGVMVTGSGGRLEAELDPFPVSSRSTLELTVTASSGNRTGRAKESLIVEPGLEEESGDAKVVSPYRIWYMLGIALFVAMDIALGAFLVALRRKAREAGSG